tara:strand:+ start:5583 stop:10499 length:4917 start_codon:yes stop_codon:yes gene_type:complete
MAGQKKFGTFSGVLTPSLLTILGVIMYMRLGSVVGNATGIFQVILIIVFAHLISITTGLSVSSIATDKKIDKGGIYYMLTRSLGLPIGGAIGLTIFIATAFSIALYLIGFSESIIPVINEDWATGGISTNKLRLFGSLALLVVLIIAYISTNFALKIQYVILGLIVLSLGSIFLGSSKGLKVGSDIMESPSFATLFGLFFPAVTGFTAGVAMSGDLKNPKISIPWGTMLSISIGLSVYLILSVFIYYNIDSQFLKTNNNVLIEFGAVPFLVLCGVWGATLSSALGGILGGPRILQAMSLDNITPKFFAKESGSNKEPRNALFLTFFIAEIGILIGELNVIAELVAMFYMAAYLFINLSCFLEQWSSPDFRPKFKIPLWISLLGSIATLLLMIQLNLGATLVAVLFMLIFWFWLSKKDLVLGTGDVWLSVWNSVVKTGLKNIQKKTIHKRNWQPNILLFSGNTSNRPHLIEFGKNIIGRTGMVSNFDLIETKSAKVLFPKADQNLKDDLIKDDSIFHRKLYCQNIFKGIETIATTYGFSGVEPNTVLMGWAKNTKNPIWFGEMTQKLKDLDYNILYLDYDLKKGFGNYNKIDLWWTAFDKENELSLQLIKFLRSSALWKKASLNIYYVNSEKTNSKDIISRMKTIVDKKRMVADLKVINNFQDQKNINEYIKIKSHHADIILMKLPKLNPGKEKQFINYSNDLFGQIGSALFLEASNSFIDNSKIDVHLKTISKPSNPLELETHNNSIVKTFDQNFDDQISLWQKEFEKINQSFISKIQSSILSFEEYYINVFNNKNLINELTKHLYNTEMVQTVADNLENNMALNIKEYFYSINKFLSTFNDKINFNYSLSFLDSQYLNSSVYNDKIRSKINKNLSSDKSVKLVIPIVKLFEHYLKSQFVNQFTDVLKTFGNIHVKYINQYKEFINQNSKNEILPFLETVNKEIFSNLSKELNLLVSKLINAIVKDIGEKNVKIISEDREENFDPKEYNKKWNIVESYPEGLAKNVFIFHNLKVLYCSSTILQNISNNQLDHFSFVMKEKVFSPIEKILNACSKKLKLKEPSKIDHWISQLEADYNSLKISINDNTWQINYEDIFNKFPEEIKVYSSEAINYFYNSQNNLLEKEYNLKNSLQYIYNEKIIFPIVNLIDQHEKWIQKELENLISSYKLVSFTLANQEEKDLLKDSKKKLLNTMELFNQNLSQKIDRFISFLDDLKVEINKFNDHQFLMLNESKKIIQLNPKDNSVFNLEKIQNYISEKFLSFIDMLTVEDKVSFHQSKKDKINLIREFVEKKVPSSKSISDIPKLYLQLFSNDTKPNAFFSGFISKKVSTITNAISNREDSDQNIIIVSGEPNSGKSYIINKVMKTLDYKNCYELDIPNNFIKSSNEIKFAKLLHPVNQSNSQKLVFKDLGKGSVVFLNNFELWWRKSKMGFDNVKTWIEIFKKYHNQLIFVIELNPVFKKQLLSNTDLDTLVLKYIHSLSFSKKQLEKIVDYKNNLAAVEIFNKGIKVNFSNPFRSVLNFKNIHSEVSGNIGWFNHLWISSLTKIDDDFLDFSYDYDLTFPYVFSNKELLILLQFYYHKKINLKNLKEYFDEKLELNINEHISMFKAENILITQGVYTEINPYLIKDLLHYFKNKNLI